MLNFLKKLSPIALYYKFNKEAYRVKVWENNGRKGAAPHSLKIKNLEKYLNKFNFGVIVETGTFEGHMVEAMKDKVKVFASIELNEELYSKAVERFKSDKGVKLYQGDSGDEIGGVIKDINEPILFWLDGHYSAGYTSKGELITPIRKELNAVGEHYNRTGKNHVVIIDDARLFDGTDDYPTMEELDKIIKEELPDFSYIVDVDAVILEKVK